MSSTLRIDYKKRLKTVFGWLFLILILSISFKVSNINIPSLIIGLSNSADLVKEMFPPDFSQWEDILFLSFQTIAMGFWGTVIGSIVSIFFGFLSAKNISGGVLYYVSRLIINFLRSIPEIMYAIIFVVTIGMGAFSGMLAISLSTVGILSKFYAEAVESIDSKPLEAIQATGSHKLGVIRYAIVPQVLPLFMGYNLYMLDHNIRVAMILGVVGAGGLGLELFASMRSFDYQRALAILIIIFAIVTIIDRISAQLRKRIIEGKSLNRKDLYINTISILAILSVGLISIYFIPIDLKEISSGIPRIIEFIKGMFPPDLSNLETYIKLMLETVSMAISGTFLAVVISVPIGILSAKNVVNNVIIYNAMKETSNFLRAMPELMFALLFVAAVGLGPFAGVLAIALHTAGFLGKFYAEAIENIDNKPLEAVEAVGARLIQKVRYAIFPQIIPLFNSYNLYILDRNIRASTVMGVVGAGGIGFELVMSVKLFEYQKAATIILLTLITIMLFDWISSYLRRRIV